jgi:hypothetical protein
LIIRDFFRSSFIVLRGDIELLGPPRLAALPTFRPSSSIFQPISTTSFYTKCLGKNRPHRRIFVLILSAAGFCSEKLASTSYWDALCKQPRQCSLPVALIHRLFPERNAGMLNDSEKFEAD